MFVLDVSLQSKQSGLLTVATLAIKEAIKGIPHPVGLDTTPIDVGIITFDRTVHFYNLSVFGFLFPPFSFPLKFTR